MSSQTVLEKVEEKQAVINIIGLGYVGLLEVCNGGRVITKAFFFVWSRVWVA